MGERELCLLRASEFWYLLFCRVWLGLCVHLTGDLLWTEQLANGDRWEDIEV